MEKQVFYYNSKRDNYEESFSSNKDIKSKEVEGQEINPWDQAHALKDKLTDIGYIEPDLHKQLPTFNVDEPILEGFKKTVNDEEEYDNNWPFPTQGEKPEKKIWHLSDNFAQLKSAWTTINSTDNIVRIAHLDTGYDPQHITFPKDSIEFHLQKNYVEEDSFSAEDIGSEGLLNQPGHGVGTLSILAGTHVRLQQYNYDDYLGVHRSIKIVPIRMSKSVILWKNKAFVDAMEYIISLYDNPETRCHIVTMSMGGLPIKAWADVVNKAYEKGIFIVAATGDNFGRATPTSVIYPARFKRVVAASGVTFDFSPYYKPFSPLELKIMQGNFGPRKAMTKAVAAFTPNVPWASINTIDQVSIRGAGTSASTPQIAAAVALYYQKYFEDLESMDEGWKKVELIRQALFNSALREIKGGYENEDIMLYFGNGILQAKKMLDIKPDTLTIEKEKEDSVSWPFFQIISEIGTKERLFTIEYDRKEMFETEILQLIQQSARLQQILDNEEREFDELEKNEQKEFFEIILNMPETSNTLKQFITSIIK